jgi:hypothetical protein
MASDEKTPVSALVTEISIEVSLHTPQQTPTPRESHNRRAFRFMEKKQR